MDMTARCHHRVRDRTLRGREIAAQDDGPAGLIGLQVLMTLVLITFLAPTLWMVSSSLKSQPEIFASPDRVDPGGAAVAQLRRTRCNCCPSPRLRSTRFDDLPPDRARRRALFVDGGLLVRPAALARPRLLLRHAARHDDAARDHHADPDVHRVQDARLDQAGQRVDLPGIFDLPRNYLPLTVPFWLALAPLYVFLMRQFFKSIPMELEEAALVDGASRFRILFNIILPLSKPVIATVAVFAFLQSYNDFLQPLIYINGRQNWTLALGPARAQRRADDGQLGAALRGVDGGAHPDPDRVHLRPALLRAGHRDDGVWRKITTAVAWQPSKPVERQGGIRRISLVHGAPV